MSITISRQMTPEEIKKALERLPSGKRLQAKKHVGVIKIPIDPLQYQKSSRNEWN